MTSTAIPSPKGETLKPCPFCGSDALSIKPNIHTGLLRVQCEACWAVTATSVSSNNRQTAIAAWNRRASPDARREALEEAAKVADEVAADEREEKMADKEAEGEDYDPYSYGAGFLDGSWVTAQEIATAIRALSQGE